jgi:hypothetical protein
MSGGRVRKRESALSLHGKGLLLDGIGLRQRDLALSLGGWHTREGISIGLVMELDYRRFSSYSMSVVVMDQERQNLIAELESLLPSARARAIYLRRDNSGLTRAIAKLNQERELIVRKGHIHSSGICLQNEDGRTVIKYSPMVD